MGSDVEVIEVPSDVYDDILEASLLLSSAEALFFSSFGDRPESYIGLLPRNDLLHWASSTLEAAPLQAFLKYANELAVTFATRAHPILPPPVADAGAHDSVAESLARGLLEEGRCPLWSGVRQVVRLLWRETPRHQHMLHDRNASSASIGAYSHGPHNGLCKMTLTHQNVACLLNCLVAHVCPHHTWTTLAVLYNYATKPHIDASNGRYCNLVLSLSLHEGGELWIEDACGSAYIEHEGRLIRGTRHGILLQAVRFPAYSQLHQACSWACYDRVTLVAYTAQRWERLGPYVHHKLEGMGFLLPPPEIPVARPSLLQDRLPCVLRG